ncbi:MAG: hypothetical protein ABI668_04825 [Sphingorhabdus sp.]
MSKKASAARTEAFFKALAETGNQTISAERARVSRGWVSLHRSNDPEFKARMEAAVAGARERLSGASAVKTSAKWAAIDGEELVVRGSNGRRAQVSRARLKQWTARGEARFLSVLSATCNVKLACRAVALSVPSAYMHRERWPDFGRRWDEAVEEGYLALEMGMLENAMASIDPDGPHEVDRETAIPMEPMTPQQGLALLHMNKHSAFRHWARRTGVRGWGRNRREEMSDDELTRSLLKKLAVLRLRLDAGEA